MKETKRSSSRGSVASLSASKVSVSSSKARTALLKELYRQMVVIRRVEEALAKAYSQGKMGGFLHLVIGQEASCVGALAALSPGDYVFTSYREHGHCIAKAGATKEICQAVLAELLGRETGTSNGFGGSMHLFDVANRFMGGYGIVGGQVPLATGTAFASKYKNTGDVTLCFLGDGAVPQGAFHEALSLAGLWKLPVVFIIENNQYAMGTPLSRTVAVSDFTKRAVGYGMASDRFVGDDVLVVKERISEAVDRARKQSLPTLVELITYRYRGHSISDPGNYRTKDEIEEWKKRDSILLARQELVKAFGEEAMSAYDEELKSFVQDCVRFAEESPPAQAEHLWQYVYATPGTDPQRM